MRASWCIIALFASGCDPVWRIQGAVVDPSGAPVSGAKVMLVCPADGPDGAKTITDAYGQFDLSGAAGASGAGSCSVSIDKAGYAPKTVKAKEVCSHSAEAGDYAVACDPKKSPVTLTP